MRDLKRIILHCSDSEWGDVKTIRSWHRERGFTDIGYHFVILNGKTHSVPPFHAELDGQTCPGRPLARVGAHVYGHNKDSVGVCLIGRESFTPAQLDAARDLVLDLMNTYDIPLSGVLGHCELNPGKTCPNISMDGFRTFLLEDEREAA